MRILSFTSLVVISLNAAAQDYSLSEEDFLAEDPMMISSATRISQKINDVPASVTVIDRAMIEASSAINLIELLKLVPGFQVGSIDGTESTATYHGLSNQHNKRLQILINGRSIYQSTFGGALWYSLPVTIDEIEKIEVIRGPNAASYGANAFSAVVNISTYAADHEPGLKISHLNGDRDTERTLFTYSKALENSSFRIAAEHEGNTGYQYTYRNSHDQPGDPVLPIRTGFPLYDDHFHRQISLRMDHLGETGANHLLEFGFKNLKFGSGYFDNLKDGTFDYKAPHDKQVDSYYFNYVWSKNKSLLVKNNFRVSYNYVDQNETWFGSVEADALFPGSPFLPDAYTRDTSFRDTRLDLEFQQNRMLKPTLQSVLGFGVRYDESNSIGYLLNDKHSRYSISGFGHLEWKQLPWLTWNLGGYLESHENIGTFFSPRVAVNLKPNNIHTFRANISQAYRMPSFRAEYADRYTVVTTNALSPLYVKGDLYDWYEAGNSGLDPERMTSFELGYRGSYFNNNLDIDVRLAKEKIEDIIDGPRTISGSDTLVYPAYRWMNYGETDIESIELQIKYKPTEKSFVNLHVSHANADGFKPARATNETGDTASCSPITPDVCLNEPVDIRVPLLTTGILASHQFDGGINISSQYTYHDAYLTGGDGDKLNTPLESIDIKISKEWKISSNRLRASAIVRNISDEFYEDFANDNLVGREAYFQLEIGLQ